MAVELRLIVLVGDRYLHLNQRFGTGGRPSKDGVEGETWASDEKAEKVATRFAGRRGGQRCCKRKAMVTRVRKEKFCKPR